jgi:hypothetical protein
LLEWAKLINYTELLLKLKNKIDYILNFYKNNENISKILSLNIDNSTSILDKYEEDFIKEYFNYKQCQKKILEDFNSIPEDIY